MGRSPNSKKEAVLKKGPWTAEEDKILTAYIQQHGHGSWRALPEKAGLQRCGKSCRLRWINYLRPDIKRGKFSLQEEQTIIQLHALLGNRWSAMAAHLPKRTDNEIKNHWNTHLKKRLIKLGIDPMTHKPRTDVSSGPGSKNNASNLSHMAQWESARLEAEARLVRESKQVTVPNPIQPKNQRSSASIPTSNSSQLMINNDIAMARPSKPRCLDVLKAWQGVVAGMFAFSNQDLDSPTSTLSFPDGTVQAPAAFGLNSNNGEMGFDDKGSGPGWRSETATESDGENSLKSFEKLIIQMQEENDEERITIMDSCVDQLHGLTTGSIDIDTWSEDSFIGNKNVPIANIMEGLSDVLNASMGLEKSNDQSCSGNMVENSTNCWDSVLNLYSSPYGSPVF